LDKAGSECNQLCITDYYKILNDVEKLKQQNKELHLLLQSALSADENPSSDECSDENSQLPLTGVLQKILENAMQNSAKLPRQRRHPEILKSLLFRYLFMQAH